MQYTGLIAGLGNPGRNYANTRHNCGFLFIEYLLKTAQTEGKIEELPGKKFACQLWSVSLPRLKGVWLAAMPQTFMNDSGRSVQPLLAWHNLSARDLIVVHDELDIPAGELRFKFGGGLAGHNGLRSIAQCTGTQDFARLRIGIGKPTERTEVLGWVLGRPSPEERKLIMDKMPAALETIRIYSAEGPQAAAVFARHA